MPNDPGQKPPRPIAARPLRKADWPLIEELFGDNGACGGCWCMFWRIPKGGAYWDAQKGEGNRRAFRKLVERGAATGVLALDGKTPIGWASVAPRADFAYFDRSRTIPPPADEKTWSVTCFFVKRGWRRRGVAGALLAEAVDYASRKKARLIEGYPAASWDGAKMPDAFVHTGLPSLFEAAGFEFAEAAGARAVWRRRLAG
ncbi:MAG: GNAT family N-acetyltransferase [Parvularculaceae bacterium]|nr:GNAT family N-acetyltransferase [Parvularculaceae bacterium]